MCYTFFKALQTNTIVLILFCAGLLCFMAIFNGYPLIFNSDTAMYLNAAYSKHPGPDRPILYGLFMRFVSLRFSLWYVVIIQSLLISTLIFYCFKYLLPIPTKKLSVSSSRCLIAFVALISFFTGGSFEVSWLMPDVFISISILCLILILFCKQPSPLFLYFISVLFIISIAMHNSNFFIALVCCTTLLVGFLLRSIKVQFKQLGIKLNRVLFLLLLLIGSNLLLSSVNYFYGGKFKSSNGGIVFLMGSFVEMGVVDAYLKDNCGKPNLSLCEYRDSLPNNFLWNKKSPLRKMGSWEKNEAEYRFIITDILKQPKYLKTVIFNSITLTCKQFFLFDTGEAHLPWKIVDKAILNYYPNEFKYYANSRQSFNSLSFEGINFIQNIIVFASLFIYVFMLSNQVHNSIRGIIWLFLFLVIFNAWFCGTFSGVFPRYQSRLIWLLPLPIFLYANRFYNRLTFSDEKQIKL